MGNLIPPILPGVLGKLRDSSKVLPEHCLTLGTAEVGGHTWAAGLDNLGEIAALRGLLVHVGTRQGGPDHDFEPVAFGNKSGGLRICMAGDSRQALIL